MVKLCILVMSVLVVAFSGVARAATESSNSNKVSFSNAEDDTFVVEKPKQENPYKKKKKLRANAGDKIEQDDFKKLEQELELLK